VNVAICAVYRYSYLLTMLNVERSHSIVYFRSIGLQLIDVIPYTEYYAVQSDFQVRHSRVVTSIYTNRLPMY